MTTITMCGISARNKPDFKKTADKQAWFFEKKMGLSFKFYARAS